LGADALSNLAAAAICLYLIRRTLSAKEPLEIVTK